MALTRTQATRAWRGEDARMRAERCVRGRGAGPATLCRPLSSSRLRPGPCVPACVTSRASLLRWVALAFVRRNY